MTRAGSATVALGVGGGAAFCLALALHLLAPAPGEEQRSTPVSVQLFQRYTPPDPPPADEPRPEVVPASARRTRPPRRSPDQARNAPRPGLPTLSLPFPGLAGASLPLPDWPMGEVSGLGTEGGEQRVEEPPGPPEEPFRWVFGPPHLTAREKERYYPRHALRRGLSGEVELLVRIGSGGRVEEVRVLRSEPPGLFDAAAKNLARTWRGSRADLRRATILFEPENDAW